MDINTMKSMFGIGENVAVEFKRCGNGIEHDTYESVCSFLNRFGGDIFMGVEDTGKPVGVPEKAATDMIRNFISVISNPALFSPTIYLTPKIINYEGYTIIHVHIPPSAEVHSYKRIIYDRVDDADIKVTATSQIAAIMLLGKDDLILNVCPAYETDALVRKINVDRYDDRETVRTNLIESYDQLMEFARKHLPDKFFLENTDRVSIRNVLAREMLGNTLMHREYSNAYTAKFVIEMNKMYVENANRAVREGIITPDNLEPNPKNPIIASFFRNIGRADKLGSGVRNLFKYSKYYSGKEPEFIEGDIFRIIVPLDETYSFDMDIEKTDQTVEKTDQTNKKTDQIKYSELTDRDLQLLEVIRNYPKMTNEDISQELKWSVSKVKYHMKKLKKNGIIKRIGSSRKGSWNISE